MRADVPAMPPANSCLLGWDATQAGCACLCQGGLKVVQHLRRCVCTGACRLQHKKVRAHVRTGPSADSKSTTRAACRHACKLPDVWQGRQAQTGCPGELASRLADMGSGARAGQSTTLSQLRDPHMQAKSTETAAWLHVSGLGKYVMGEHAYGRRACISQENWFGGTSSCCWLTGCPVPGLIRWSRSYCEAISATTGPGASGCPSTPAHARCRRLRAPFQGSGNGDGACCAPRCPCPRMQGHARWPRDGILGCPNHGLQPGHCLISALR